MEILMATPTFQRLCLLLMTAAAGITTTGWPIAAALESTTPAANAKQHPAAGETNHDRSHQVLRHAVFFAFSEASSKEDVQKIVHAFQELPDKIEEIIDFQAGTNNSPEGLADGLTHCFLLTFKDEAGRAAYLPHVAHKAFGAMLGQHPTQIFVFDYWGAPYQPLEQELKHAVFFKFKADADPVTIKAVEASFAALPGKIDEIKTFEWGKNHSPEGKDEGFTHCFMVGFGSEAGRAAYLPHPEHRKFVELVGPVVDKVRVLDFWAGDPVER